VLLPLPMPSTATSSVISPVAIFATLMAAPITSAGRFSPRQPLGIGLAYLPAVFAHLVQRGADAIVIQDVFSFRSAMLESKFALNGRGVTKIPRERQPVCHGKAVFFAVLDHLASDALH
jgi:hypothetical protein